ncbi:MAG: gamma-glutamylcyclotransferase [Thermoplasmata archaeon]
MPWIFGYGSLMWDPFFSYLRRESAVLPGYHRAFVTSFVRVWGQPDAPCVVLGLEPGGACEGVVYEVERDRAPGIEDELRAFEGEAFEVTRRTVLVGDEEVKATVALNRPSHQDYLGRLTEAKRVVMVLRARGPKESCLDYVRKTAESLTRLGIEDLGVLQFLSRVEQAEK